MSGMSDYSAENVLNYIAGRVPMPTLPTIYMALFTSPPTSDAGTGGTEVSTSGTAYARVQLTGTLTAGASWTTSSTTITLASAAPAWLTALGTTANPGNGVNVYDSTNSQQIGTVQSVSGTTVTLQSTAAHVSSGSSDSLIFSAFSAPSASSGNEPGTTPANITNGAQINFATATASWGTVEAWGIYDASTSGDLIAWDYLGNYQWQPCEVTSGSPAVVSCHAHGFGSSSVIVYTTKYQGTQPSFTSGNFTGVMSPTVITTDTFEVINGGVTIVTSSSGNGQVRAVQQQSVPNNVQMNIPASSLVVSQA
jgi:hypothetical protein